MHENPRQIQLDLKSNINIRSVNGWTPPESESSIWDLVQTGPLSICKFFILHGFLKTDEDEKQKQKTSKSSQYE